MSARTLKLEAITHSLVLSEARVTLCAPADIWLLGRTPTPEQAVALADGRPGDLPLLGKAAFAPERA